MRSPALSEPELPERDVDRLARRLNRHRLWNCTLMVFPPLFLLAYAATLLFVGDRVGLDAVVFSWSAFLAVGFAVILYFQTNPPDRRDVARLLDTHSGGRDHFLTLATMHRLHPRSWVSAKLRAQASQLLRRVNFRRDFPYRPRRGSVVSAVLCAAAIIVLHLGLEKPALSLRQPADLEKVQEIAQRLSRAAGLETLALGAKQAADDLRARIRGTPMMQKIIEELDARFGSGSQSGQSSGEGTGSSTRKSKQSSGGREPKQSGGSERASEDGEGEGESGQAPGDGQEGMAQPSSGDQGEQQGAEKGNQGEQAAGAGGAGERDESQHNADTGGRRDRGEREGARAGGASEPDQAIPKGGEPDRFNPPGTGKEGIEGGRFVTVALPKALSSGGGRETLEEERDGGSNTAVPVSNIPLRPRDDPAAAAEQQHIPIEYERIFK